MTSSDDIGSQGSRSDARSYSMDQCESCDKYVLLGLQSMELEDDASAESEPALRGATHDKLFEGFGAVWENGYQKMGGSYFKRSHEVDAVDDFMLHEWDTSRWPKFLSLCLIYNGDAALAACFVFLIIMVILESIGCLPEATYIDHDEDVVIEGRTYYIRKSIRCKACMPLVLFAFLFCWQHVRRCAFGPRTVFLDKMCVDYRDDSMRRRSVRHISQAIKKSTYLVVLWTPRMFSRLMCTHEVFAWLHLDKPRSNVVFQPTSQPGIVLGAFGLNLLYFSSYTAWSVNKHSSGLSYHIALVVQVITGLATAILTLQLGWFLIKEQEALDEVAVQLTEFSFQSSSCFCCDVDHIHPRTQERLACDRRHILRTLKEWCTKGNLADVTEWSDAHVMRYCDSVARFALEDEFLDIVVRSRRLPLKYIMLASLPFWAECADSIPSYAQTPYAASTVACQIAMPLLMYPSLFRLFQGLLQCTRSLAFLIMALPVVVSWRFFTYHAFHELVRTGAWEWQCVLAVVALVTFILANRRCARPSASTVVKAASFHLPEKE